jgi:hypothetical protein
MKRILFALCLAVLSATAVAEEDTPIADFHLKCYAFATKGFQGTITNPSSHTWRIQMLYGAVDTKGDQLGSDFNIWVVETVLPHRKIKVVGKSAMDSCGVVKEFVLLQDQTFIIKQ